MDGTERLIWPAMDCLLYTSGMAAPRAREPEENAEGIRMNQEKMIKPQVEIRYREELEALKALDKMCIRDRDGTLRRCLRPDMCILFSRICHMPAASANVKRLHLWQRRMMWLWPPIVPVSYTHLDVYKRQNLKYIGVLATGYNVVDVAAAKEAGVIVTNIPTYGTDAVSQYAIALLLELCHHIGEHSDCVKKGDWTNNPVSYTHLEREDKFIMKE